MYFVDKDKLALKIKYLNQLIKNYETNKSNHYAFERIAQMLIESSVDIGNMIIDAFILRDPGNYKDVIDILELEGVISNYRFWKRRLFIMKNYKGYLIDLDGTMYMGTAEIDGAAQFIDYLNKNDIPHLYVTNNSTKTPEEVTEKLKEMKIDAKPDEVVTSALATANYIAEENSQASVYMLGGNGLRTALTDAGLTVKKDENVDYVVIGLDEAVTYEKLAIATLAVRKGAKFSSTNPDVSIPKERGFLPGNGAITSVVSVSTGQQPQFIGKPETIIMQIALDILKLDKSEVAMVGDLYDTDIMYGINVGMDTVHVQTGVTSYEEIQTKQPKPTYSFKDLNEAIAELESNTN